MPLPVLYSFRRCPYAIRARLALRQAQVKVELREVILRHKPEAMLAASPKGTVPVLQLPNGQVLDESLEIMRWGLLQNDPAGWLQLGDTADARHLIAINDGPFKALLDRYKYPERHPQQSAIDYRDQAVDLFIAPLNQRLTVNTDLLGQAPSLADLAIAPFIRQFAQVDGEWFAGAPCPALRLWLQRQVETDLFTAVMHKYPAWQPGDAVTAF